MTRANPAGHRPPRVSRSYRRWRAMQADMDRYYEECRRSPKSRRLGAAGKTYCARTAWMILRRAGRYPDYPAFRRKPEHAPLVTRRAAEASDLRWTQPYAGGWTSNKTRGHGWYQIVVKPYGAGKGTAMLVLANKESGRIVRTRLGTFPNADRAKVAAQKHFATHATENPIEPETGVFLVKAAFVVIETALIGLAVAWGYSSGYADGQKATCGPSQLATK